MAKYRCPKRDCKHHEESKAKNSKRGCWCVHNTTLVAENLIMGGLPDGYEKRSK